MAFSDTLTDICDHILDFASTTFEQIPKLSNSTMHFSFQMTKKITLEKTSHYNTILLKVLEPLFG